MRLRFRAISFVLVLYVFLVVNVYAPADFSVSASPTSFNFNVGSSGTSTITVTSLGGFNQNVALNTTITPSGLTCSLIPSTVSVPGNGAATSTLVCTGNTVGSYTVIITGTYQTFSHSAVITVNVQDFAVSLSPSTIITPVNVASTATVSVTAINGYQGTVSLTASSSPAGPSCNVSPGSVTLPPSPSSTTLSCTGYVVGNYTVAVTGTSSSLSRTASLNLRVSDFSITITPQSVTVPSGISGASTVTLLSQNGFSSTVSLALSVSPSGLACSLSRSTITLTTIASSMLNCNDSVGTYTVTITATGATLAHAATVTYSIQDFTISSLPSLTVNSGAQGIATISLASVNGFKGSVALATATSGPGIVCSLIPMTVTLTAFASSTLSCTGSAGVYQVTVTGTNGTLSHNIALTYTVQDVLLVPATTGISLTGTSSGSTTIIIVGLDGYSGTVALSTTVSPANGLSCNLTPSSITLGTFGTSTLSCSGSPGTYNVTINGVGGGGLLHATTVTYTIVGQQTQSFSLFYFLVAAAMAASGLAGTALFKRFNTTDAPFDTFYKIAGGLETPSTLMLAGAPGAGTTTLGLQILQSQLAKGKYCGLLTYDAFPSEIEAKMKSVGLDITGNLKDGSLKILDCYSALAGNERAGIDPLDFTEISIRVTDIIDTAKTRPVTILLDSITPIFTGSQVGNAMNFLRVLGAKVKNSRGVFIFTTTDGSLPDEVRSKVEAQVDGLIEIGLTRKRGRIIRTLLIKKLAGHQASIAPAEFAIRPNMGIVFKKHRITLHKASHSISPKVSTTTLPESPSKNFSE